MDRDSVSKLTNQRRTQQARPLVPVYNDLWQTCQFCVFQPIIYFLINHIYMMISYVVPSKISVPQWKRDSFGVDVPG